MDDTGAQKPDGKIDAELLARIAKQDRTALRTFFARYHVRLYRYLVRLTRNEGLAEDMVNEVFLSVWRNAASFQGQSAVSSWVYAIAHNRAMSELRKKSEITLDDPDSYDEADDSDTPEETVMKTDKGAALRECLLKLTPEHREVIELVYYHDKSVKEAADIVGIPENTVKTRMFHARQKLSVILREAGIDRGWP